MKPTLEENLTSLEEASYPKYYKFIFLIVVACFSIIPLYDLLINGPFMWHIRQPAVIEGGLELGVLFAITYCSLKYLHQFKSAASVLLVAVFMLYLRRHNIDAVFVLTLGYVSALYFMGSIFIGELKIEYKSSLTFLLGVALWVLYSFLLSVFYLANIEVLACSAIVIFVVSLFSKKHSLVYKVIHFIRDEHSSAGITNPLLKSSLITICLILFVQTSQNPSYDEFWYSLRGQEVLNIHGSFFEPILMLQHWASFYPKLYEITIYPLEYIDSFAAERMFTVFVLIFFMLAISQFSKPKIGSEKSLFVILSLITIPAVANSSVLSKPDLIGAFTVIMALLYFIGYSKSRSASYFFLSISLLIFSLSTKLAVIPYVGILGMSFATYFLLNIKKTVNDVLRIHYLVYTLLIFTFLLATYRTILIVGIPFVSLSDSVSVVGNIYSFLGFDYKELYGDLNSYGELKSRGLKYLYNNPLELFLKYNFFPSQTRLIFAWISNLYTLLFGLFLLLLVKERAKISIYRQLAFILSAVFIFVIFYQLGKGKTPGGDGNYHLIPIISLITLICLENRIIRLYKLLTPILLMNIIILFITNHSWSIGTNQFDLNFSKDPFNKDDVRISKLKSVGAEDIFYMLAQEETQNKVIGQGPEGKLFLLNASYESGSYISIQRPYLFESFEVYSDFLIKTKTTHLLYPKYIPAGKFVEYSERLRQCRLVEEYIGEAYILLKLKNSIIGCNSALPSENSRIKNDMLIQFTEPTLISSPNYKTNLWLKPFQIINPFQIIKNKYYPDSSLAVRNGTAISFEFRIEKDTSGAKYFLTLKAMPSVPIRSLKDRGLLEITVKQEDKMLVQKQFEVASSEVENIAIDLGELKGGNYNVKFRHSGWQTDMQIVLMDSKISKNYIFEK